jgi:hypothetical protein
VVEVRCDALVILTDYDDHIMKSTRIGIGPSAEQRVGKLESWGWIEPDYVRPVSIPPPVRIDVDAQGALQEDRGV